MVKRTREERRQSLLKYGKDYPARGRDMQHMLDLDDKYPEVGLFDEQCISAEVGAGWAKLLEPCLQVLKEHGCKVGQVKQKFCELRIYWDSPPWLDATFKTWNDAGRPAPNPHNLFTKVTEVINQMTKESLHTCEACGQYAADGADEVMGGRRLCDECNVKGYY